MKFSKVFWETVIYYTDVIIKGINISVDDDAEAVFAELKAFTDQNYQGGTYPGEKA